LEVLEHFSALGDPPYAWKVVCPLPEILMVVLCRMPAATVSIPTISSRSAETSLIVSAIAGALAASPDAELVYLDHELVLFAADDGFDLVAAFHAAGRRVDAYTIQRADAAGLAVARRLLALGVDQITTDDADGLAAALASSDFQSDGIVG
jgi:hypothetical protein